MIDKIILILWCICVAFWLYCFIRWIIAVVKKDWDRSYNWNLAILISCLVIQILTLINRIICK